MHTKNFDPYDFSKKEVEGVTVYYKNLPWAPCIHINIVFGTGASNDPKDKEGLSHFLEHMIFDGSPLFPNKKAVTEWSKLNVLNSWNAWTGYYNTNYHLKCLPEKYHDALTGIKDMIFNPFLREKDVEHERKVITQEAWGVYKNEKYLKYTKEVIKNIFHRHWHDRVSSPLGWPETISKFSQKDISNWHGQNYKRGNFYIILVGKVEEKHIDALKKYLVDIPKSHFVTQKKSIVLKPQKNRWIKTADEIGEPKEQVEITISRAMNYLPKEFAWVASHFKRLTYDLLLERLRIENSLCYDVHVNTWLLRDYSEIFMNIKTEKKNIKIVEKEFWKILKEIVEGKHKDKFNTIKHLGIDQIKSGERMSEDIVDTAIDQISRYDGQINRLTKNVKEMKSVTYFDVVKFAKEVFDPKYVFTEIILPSKK